MLKNMKIIQRKMIAPCGMNCTLCLGFLREANKCEGCRSGKKLGGCNRCIIVNCEKRLKNNWQYCFKCDTYPCTRLKQLDKRYRTKYEMSMIENLDYIRDYGIKKFLAREQKRWVKGGQIYCVHKHTYFPSKTNN